MATQTAPLDSAAFAVKARRPNNMVWFELPVSDLNRAIAFYENAFATELKTDARFPGIAIFPRSDAEAVTGALAESGNGQPSSDGTVVYLNCDGDIDGVIKRSLAAGATLLKEVAQLPGGMGWIAQLRDLDGNRVGLHATF
jgi:predicted enzyme related to lactoylglutathione lyase